MKNYFNSRERTNHIIIMAMSEIIKEFAKSNALTEEEVDDLKYAEEILRDVTASIFARFGEGYKRKIEGTLDINTIKLVSKFGKTDDCIDYMSTEDIAKSLEDVMFFNCLDCSREEWMKCPVYNMAINCGVSCRETGGCPYKL